MEQNKKAILPGERVRHWPAVAAFPPGVDGGAMGKEKALKYLIDAGPELMRREFEDRGYDMPPPAPIPPLADIPVIKDPRRPAHYQKQPIQVWDFVLRNKLGFLEGNVIKYVTRHKDKNGLADLHKAKHYLDKLIEEYPNEVQF